VEGQNPDNIFHLSQWEAYQLPVHYDPVESFDMLLDFMQMQQIESIEATTQIIIAPGYKFKIIKGIITNFHQPKSSLLLLIAALVGDHWKWIYEYALSHNFRFLSYGDSSLLMGDLD
jgi:S-adenosylmethionine:tRNA ribosyltransferase-isomerase